MILKGTGATIRALVYVDGTLTALSDLGTVTVVDEDGNEIATGAGGDGGTGVVTFPLTPTHTANVNKLTITWAGLQIAGGDEFSIVTRDEVVGELLFSEAEARAWQEGAMANTTAYTDAMISAHRDGIHDAFEQILGYPLGHRYRRETLDGEGAAKLRLDGRDLRTIRSVKLRDRGSTTWTALTAGELSLVTHRRWGLIEREDGGVFPEGGQNVRVAYEAGRDIPYELRREALRVLRQQLVPDGASDRTLFTTNQNGQVRYAVADSDRGRWFGIPQTDAVLSRLREPGIA